MEKKTKSKKLILIIIGIVVIAVAAVVAIYFLNGRNDFSEKISTLEKLGDGGKYQEAETLANEILKMNPDKDTKVDALWELAFAQYSLGKLDKAMETAKSMQSIDSPSSHYLVGLLYMYNGKKSEAIDELKEAEKESYYLKDEIDKIIAQIQGSSN